MHHLLPSPLPSQQGGRECTSSDPVGLALSTGLHVAFVGLRTPQRNLVRLTSIIDQSPPVYSQTSS